MNTGTSVLVRSMMVGLAFALAACGGSQEGGDAIDDRLGTAQQEVRVCTENPGVCGLNVSTGAYGLVDFVASNPGWPQNNGCTGSMIAPNAVVTAAHCFLPDSNVGGSGPVNVTVRYYDPDLGGGRRQVYSGSATWTTLATFSLGSDQEPIYPQDATDDLALLIVPATFGDTDYHDYKRFFDGSLDTGNLRFYGAGVFDFAGSNDDKLRSASLSPELEAEHIITENYDLLNLCKGDSGGPLLKVTSTPSNPNSLELIVSVLAGGETSNGPLPWQYDYGDQCSNPGGDSYHTRIQPRLSWVEANLGRTCPRLTGASHAYRRCFDLPFIEDVDFEGLSRTLETAIAIPVIAPL
jgi:hypothetical protein